MSKYQYFKTKRGTDYDLQVKKHYELLPKWNEVFGKVSGMLGENITKLAFSNEVLVVDPAELTKDENKKLFRKDGYIKSNTKQAKLVNENYKKIIDEVGLSEFQELRLINFCYGVMRSSHQSLESYTTHEHDIYFKADFDLARKSGGMVEPVTEIEYHETLLKEVKRNETKESEQ